MGMKTWYSKVKGFNGVTVLNVDRGIEIIPMEGRGRVGDGRCNIPKVIR
jgi:hypothetical protein